MTDSPPKLRGDLSKWLCEIHTGVYVGHTSSRVRDALWDRVCQNLKHGRATMVYTTNGEQGMDFRVHNTTWTPVDFDGVKLMRRPLPQVQVKGDLQPGFSWAAKRRMIQRKKAARTREQDCYIILDLETTGLKPDRDRIVEFGALKVEQGVPVKSFSRLIRSEKKLPQQIVELTGITEELLKEQGTDLQQALQEFLQFIGKEKLIGYHIAFDMDFLRVACQRYDMPAIANPCFDLLGMARRSVYGVANYRLKTLAEHFAIPQQKMHRALDDCELMFQLYGKLKEKQKP